MPKKVAKKANPALEDEEVQTTKPQKSAKVEAEVQTEKEVEPKTSEDTKDPVEETEKPAPKVAAQVAPVKAKPLIEKVQMPSQKRTSLPTNMDAALAGDAKKMKGVLESQIKYPILIPLGPGEKEGAIKQGWCNGFMWEVPKGVLVNVPEEIFNILMNNMKLNNEAGRDMLISRDADVEEALL